MQRHDTARLDAGRADEPAEFLGLSPGADIPTVRALRVTFGEHGIVGLRRIFGRRRRCGRRAVLGQRGGRRAPIATRTRESYDKGAEPGCTRKHFFPRRVSGRKHVRSHSLRVAGLSGSSTERRWGPAAVVGFRLGWGAGAWRRTVGPRPVTRASAWAGKVELWG
jgi:hypothetical protein